MKTILVAFLALSSGCWGYSEMDSEMTGQVKKVHHNTPIVCPNYDDVDVSLGILKNGVGSMSSQDMFLTIWNDADRDLLEKAALSGSIVDIKYSTWRCAPCRDVAVVQYVKLVK